ncbi:MAG TPA: O-antigen ligase family protein [Azospirillaceae bacterium]|nr:O-antigen ligase family protein [Azospirillaceae bacterium]
MIGSLATALERRPLYRWRLSRSPETAARLWRDHGGPAALRGLGWLLMAGLLGLFIGFSVAVLPMQMVMVPASVVILLVGMVFWGLPDLPRVPARLTVRLFYVAVATSLVLPTYLAFDLPGLPWISVIRITASAALLGFAICYCASSAVRAEVADVAAADPVLVRLALCVLGAFALSIPLSMAIAASFTVLMNALIHWYFPFFCCLFVLRSHRNLAAFFRLLVACTIVTVLVAGLEFHLERRVFLDLVPQSLVDQNPTLQNIWRQQIRNGMYRASANFLVPLSYGEYLALAAPFCLFFIFHPVRRSDFVLGFAAFLLVLAGTVLCGARVGFVGVIVSCAAFAVLYALRLVRRKGSSLVGSMLLALLPIGLMSVPALLITSRRFYNMVLGGGETAASTGARFVQWELAMPRIVENPLTGHGLGMGAAIVGYAGSRGQLSVDSYVLSLITETGLLGLCAFVVMLGWAVWRGASIYATPDREGSAFAGPIAAALCGFMVTRLVLSQLENHTLVFILLGTLVVVARYLGPVPGEGPRRGIAP